MPEPPEPRSEPDPGHTRRSSEPAASLVGGYTDFTEIGRGGFGIVYRAVQLDVRRTVAVKILSGVYDDTARARFESERFAMGSLSDHPNVVTVHGSGITVDGRPYIAMELLTGGTLRQRIEPGRLPWAEAAAIGVDISGALQRAHDLGVLHRDVKPENVLLSSYGEPKLADFGIARLEGGYATRSGVVTATLAHAAPELLAGAPASPATDIYALASTVFTLVAGSEPFAIDAHDGSLPGLLARITSEAVPDLRALGVPDAMCSALEAGLAKDPADRPGSAAAFGRALQLALRSAGIEPPALVVDGSPHERIATASTATPSGTRAGAPEPDAPPSRRRGALLAIGVAGVVIAAVAGVIALTAGSGSKHASPTTSTTHAVSSSGPAMPTTLAGFREHGKPTTTTVRVFAGQPNYILSFPWAGNGCNDGRTTTTWRSTGEPVAAGRTGDHADDALTQSAALGVSIGRSGLIIANACEEPVFFFVSGINGDTLVDVAVTTQSWLATP